MEFEPAQTVLWCDDQIMKTIHDTFFACSYLDRC